MKLKICYIGNIIGHGEVLSQWGTGFVILLERNPITNQVQVICPISVNTTDFIDLTSMPKIRVIPTYKLNSSISLLKIIGNIKSLNPDVVIFNSNPTSFGKKTLSGFIGNLLPYVVSTLTGIETVVIRHSSSLTNNLENLGFRGIVNSVKTRILNVVESFVFSRVTTYFLLQLYCDITKNLGTKLFRNEFFEIIPTMWLNRFLEDKSSIKIVPGLNQVPNIMLHGFWSPHKNLAFILKVLERLKERNLKFKLCLSGKVNDTYPLYKYEFEEILNRYSNVIDEIGEYVAESNLLWHFLRMDLIILPYATSGGQSGVMEIASALDKMVMVVSHPEYEEKSILKNKVILLNSSEFEATIESFIKGFNSSQSEPSASRVISTAEEYLNAFLNSLKPK